MGFAMRRRLKNFLPVFLIALMVQIFAPIAACWAAGIAASDPLAAAIICHDNSAGSGETDPGGPHVRDGCCSICNVLQTGTPVDPPEMTVGVIERSPEQVAWLDFVSRLADVRARSHAQARAPPSIS
ncbi:DUF2946 domain-containing protein [Bradyrhizobium elkanii]|jgi:hypothetical protein|uniref:DUF2946 domain-containing protein n=1 Tax=Bradyrhizobium elkanii TaxID=29448 RepID=UPI0004129CF0|nr:DUF2946 domain-containing protein [Bradyrhizobium elkanii]